MAWVRLVGEIKSEKCIVFSYNWDTLKKRMTTALIIALDVRVFIAIGI